MKALVVILWLAASAGAAPAVTPPAAPEPVATPRSPATMAPAPELPGFDDTRVRLPPMTVAPGSPPIDRRPIYVGLGVVMLAAGLWWNRRQRDRFEREDERDRRDRPPRARPRVSRRPDDDADADDLHAAARGEPPDRQAP